MIADDLIRQSLTPLAPRRDDTDTMRMSMFPTTVRPRQKLLVFARLPELGRVKTRIAAEIGHERTLDAYRAMLDDLLARIGHSDEEIQVEIMWTASQDATGDDLRAAFGDRMLAMQTGATLGDRMNIAFSERVFFHDAAKVIAIGTDDPGIDRSTVARAFRLLDSCDWVVGPSSDGGYYLIGCRGGDFFSEVFMDIEWSTDTVLEATLEKIRDRGLTVALLPQRTDIDHASDLRELATVRRDGRLGRLLEEWGWRE